VLNISKFGDVSIKMFLYAS